jgi:cardiolipin synthase
LGVTALSSTPPIEPNESRQQRGEVLRQRFDERRVQAAGAAQDAWRNPALTFRRLFGLDRSGPPPPQTLAGAPLNPWTIPNAIGLVRLLLIPVMLWYGLRDEGGSGVAAAIFAVVAWSDYLDGMTARITGQYSRLGTLLDPFVDRLLVLSGLAICWQKDLLPHWAMIVLALRELYVMVTAKLVLDRGIELKINWAGRLGVWPTMSALFVAMLEWRTLAVTLLYIGLVMGIVASVQYTQDALRASRAEPSTDG